MGNSFQFKKFAVSQDHCAMKVGTDGVLLGAWARGGNRILDIGTGTGVIALMMAQRFPQAMIDAIEIDHGAAAQAAENAARSPFADRIHITETALQNFNPDIHYNIIVTNPPFFAHSLSAPETSRSLARQTDSLPFSAIFSFAKDYLAHSFRLLGRVFAGSFLARLVPFEAVQSEDGGAKASQTLPRGFLFVASRCL